MVVLAGALHLVGMRTFHVGHGTRRGVTEHLSLHTHGVEGRSAKTC